jgi:hypothetical protein
VVTGQCSLTFCATTLQTGQCTPVTGPHHKSMQASFEKRRANAHRGFDEPGTLCIATQGPGVCVHVRQHSGRGEGVHRNQRNSVPDISRVPGVVPDEHGVPSECQMYAMTSLPRRLLHAAAMATETSRSLQLESCKAAVSLYLSNVFVQNACFSCTSIAIANTCRMHDACTTPSAPQSLIWARPYPAKKVVIGITTLRGIRIDQDL